VKINVLTSTNTGIQNMYKYVFDHILANHSTWLVHIKNKVIYTSA